MQAVRREFGLQEGLVYMNNGTLGPVPKRVIEETLAAWRELELNPAGNGFGVTLRNAEAVRQKVADYFGCDLDEIVIMPNTSQSMNTVAMGISFEKGDRVLTTDQEHPGGLRCWEFYQKQGLIEIDKAEIPMPPKSEDEVVELLAEKITPQTKVISVSHVTTTTGLKLPMDKIGELAAAHNCLLVVDAHRRPGRWASTSANSTATPMPPAPTNGCWLPRVPAFCTSTNGLRTGSNRCCCRTVMASTRRPADALYAQRHRAGGVDRLSDGDRQAAH